ncbi:MAG: enoyl-CoA hydratase-related protein [Alphaproteobacteria bacterium]|nr:enoyl-CoA hydratase-related protein [Alphaproteobacteria bacterium]
MSEGAAKMDTSDPILVDRDGTVATVTLNRPEKLNALDLESWQRLGAVMDSLDADLELRCVVIRGAGQKAFAAGADISAFERERADPVQARRYADAVHAATNGIAACRHPSVALIQGVCVGGGLELACTCDIRICGESARFGIPIKRLGSTMAYGQLKTLVDLVGPAATKEILLEGEVFGAERAGALGLVNRVVPDAEVEQESYATARRIADGAPLVARWHKKFIARLLEGTPLGEQDIEEGFASMSTEDYRIGVRAFLDKRTPRFVGR